MFESEYTSTPSSARIKTRTSKPYNLVPPPADHASPTTPATTPASTGTAAALSPKHSASMTPSVDSPTSMTSSLSTLAPVGDAIKVLVRVRPLKQNEPPSPVVTVHGHNVVALTDPSKSEPYSVKVDHVLGPSSSQQDVFATIGETTVQHCLEGFNSSIFAYGMTGSGKTHTMLGASSRMPDGSLDQLCGLAPRVFDALFAAITQREQGVPSATDPTSLRFTVKCSFLEIYNEEVTDLLDPAATGLQIRDGDSKRGIYVQGLSETEVLNADDVLALIAAGSENRRQASTAMNERSSRSHSVFTATIEAHERTSTGCVNVRFSKLNLIDLAGSERISRTGSTGEQLTEARSINRSLTVLGRVIAALAERTKRPSVHVPYRDSRLTFLLQESLGGNSRTAIVATVTPAADSVQETFSTLAFASGAKQVRCRAVVNEDCVGDAKALQLENARLQRLIAELQARPAELEAVVLKERLERAEALFDQNNAVIATLRLETETLRRELLSAQATERRLLEETAQLRSDNASLQNSLDTAGLEIEQLQNEQRDAKKNAGETEQQLQTERNKSRELSDKLEHARTEYSRLSIEAQEASAARSRAESLLDETRAEMRQVRQEAREESTAAAAREERYRRDADEARQKVTELLLQVGDLKGQLQGETASVAKYRRNLKEINRLVDWAQMTGRPGSAAAAGAVAAMAARGTGVNAMQPSPAAQAALRIARLNLNGTGTVNGTVAGNEGGTAKDVWMASPSAGSMVKEGPTVGAT